MIKPEPLIIELPKVCDPRGNLSFIESQEHVPFDIKRSYWIYDVPGGMYREGHAFREQDEFIVALAGSFDVVLHDGSTCSVALVLSSTHYDPNDYIEDFEEYKRLKNE